MVSLYGKWIAAVIWTLKKSSKNNNAKFSKSHYKDWTKLFIKKKLKKRCGNIPQLFLKITSVFREHYMDSRRSCEWGMGFTGAPGGMCGMLMERNRVVKPVVPSRPGYLTPLTCLSPAALIVCSEVIHCLESFMKRRGRRNTMLICPWHQSCKCAHTFKYIIVSCWWGTFDP